MEITEYQIIRPSGIVLLSTLVPDGASYEWGHEVTSEIRGPIIARWRLVPGSKWTMNAYYPDGFGSTPVPWEATDL